MSRTGKKLINYHGSNKAGLVVDNLNLGEIAVVHNGQTDSLLAINDNDGALAYFVTSAAVVSMIEEKAGSDVTELSGATEALSASVVSIEDRVTANEGDITNLKTIVGETLEGYSTLCDAVNHLDDAVVSADTRLDAIEDFNEDALTGIKVNDVPSTTTNHIAIVRIDSDDIAYADTTVSGAIGSLASRMTTAESDIDNLEGLHAAGTHNGKSTVAEEVTAGINALNANVSSSTVTAGQGIQVAVKEANGKITEVAVSGNFDDKYDAKGAAATAKSEAIAAAAASANTLHGEITAIDGTLSQALNGLTIDGTHSVKTYVDDRVSSVYRYKGSVATYDALPTIGLTVGDVYNVEQAHATDPKFPAGTNVAWDGSEWDVLGGIFDLDKLATVDYVKEVSGNIKTTYDEAISGLGDRIDVLEGGSITKLNGESEGYVTVSISTPAEKATERNITVTEKVQDIETAGSSAKGLAEASDVKSYVDGKVGAESARTDAEIVKAIASAATSANSLDQKITALDGAAVKAISAGTTSNITLTVDNKTAAGLVKINATAVTGSVGTAADGSKLATAGNVKTYVDGKVGAESARTDAEIVKAIASAATSADTLNKAITGATQRISTLEAAVPASAETVYDSATTFTTNAINGLNATAGTTTVASGKHVAVQVVEAKGKVTTVTVTEDDIAGKSYVDTKFATSAQTVAADTALSDRITTLEGHEITAANITGTNAETGTTQTVTATIDNKNLTIDFKDMVIDCGTF